MGPSLKHLALSLMFEEEAAQADVHHTPFTCLETLGIFGAIGYSSRAAQLGEFLGVICPLGVQICYEGEVAALGIDYASPDDPQAAVQWESEWRSVISHMRAVQRARVGRDCYYQERRMAHDA